MKHLSNLEPVLYSVISNLPQAVIVVDKNSQVQFVNKGAVDIFGYEKEEIEGVGLESLIPLRHQERHRSYVAKFIKEKHTARKMGENLRVSGIRKNGIEFPAEAAITHLHMDGQDPLAMVILTDISNRIPDKQFIDQYLETTLASSETLLALDKIDDPISIFDQQFNVIFINKAGLNLANKSRREMFGRSLWEVSSIQGTEFERVYREAMKTQERSVHELFHEGLKKWFRINVLPSKTSLVIHAVDITKVRNFRETNKVLTNTLEQALDAGWDRRDYRDPRHKSW